MPSPCALAENWVGVQWSFEIESLFDLFLCTASNLKTSFSAAVAVMSGGFMLIMPTLESQTPGPDARPEQMRSPAQTCKLWTMFDDAPEYS